MKDKSYFLAQLLKIRGDVDALISEMGEASTAPADFKAEPPQRPAPSDPTSKSVADMVTPKQLGLIRALGREKGVDWEFECDQLHGCHTEDLTKRAASQLIEHLQKLQPEFRAKRAG